MSGCPVCGDIAQLRGRATAVGFSTMVCSNCTLEHRVPRPSLAELEAIYTETYYDSWNLQEHEEEVRRLKHRTSLGHLDILSQWCVPPGKILDVGCATGFFLEAAREVGWDPYGVELSEYAAREAERRIGAGRIHHGMLEESSYADASFRVISMMDCIEHVPNVRSVMETVQRLTEPGGCLLITTPYVGSFTYKAMGARWTHYKHEHLQYFGRESMLHLLSAYGFAPLVMEGARKHISADYFIQQFQRYKHPLITPVANAVSAVIPGGVRHSTKSLLLGDMLVIARKEARG